MGFGYVSWDKQTCADRTTCNTICGMQMWQPDNLRRSVLERLSGYDDDVICSILLCRSAHDIWGEFMWASVFSIWAVA
jgi:hypothetical protein